MLWSDIPHLCTAMCHTLIGIEDLRFLYCELRPVSDKWFCLGLQLQVPYETLQCIKIENSKDGCLLQMLTVWLKCCNPPPTWNILTKALETVGERLLAQQLRGKYCPQTEGDLWPPHSRIVTCCSWSLPLISPSSSSVWADGTHPTT